MFYITITNPVTETTTKRDYKTEKGAERAYNKAIENPDNDDLRNITLWNALRIAEALGVTIEDITLKQI